MFLNLNLKPNPSNNTRAVFTMFFSTHPSSQIEQLGVSFAAGYIAGVFCAAVSHPADNLVSKLNSKKGATVGDIIKDMGWYNLCTRGLGLRILMVGECAEAWAEELGGERGREGGGRGVGGEQMELQQAELCGSSIRGEI